MLHPRRLEREWLEADGLGGFASGTAAGIRTRRYHGLLLVACRPPADRYLLVNGVEVHATTASGTFALTSERYVSDVIHPDGHERIIDFTAEPWPTWRFELGDGVRLVHELLVVRGAPLVLLAWHVERAESAVDLVLRPFLSGRDPHGLHQENAAFRFEAERGHAGTVTWRPYAGLPAVLARSNGSYEHRPDWYRRFLYEEERHRGLDHIEDLATPGAFHCSVPPGGEAFLLFEAGPPATGSAPATNHGVFQALRESERQRRAAYATPLDKAADAFIVRGNSSTIVAGYPWFGDCGRDTFIALRGLCLATGKLEDAGSILEHWTGFVSEGMMPNRLPDRDERPEYNSADASLWYVIAVHDYFAEAESAAAPVAPRRAALLRGAVDAILEGYSRGTRYGIRVDADGLLAAGERGSQLTWMDARIGDWVVTPRVGKPVEIQALWLNALEAASRWNSRWTATHVRGASVFESRFWNEACGFLNDVVDVDHRPGAWDATLRPNQIFAVGGLPRSLLLGERARRVVDVAESKLWTPMGLRSLSPDEPGYHPRYEGGVVERDGAYHQGTAWPWLLGPFVEAWVRVRGGGARVRRQAATRFLTPLTSHLDAAGLGHVSEIADAEPPHSPRGCPFQAWSLGEYLRLQRRVLAVSPGYNAVVRRRRDG